MNPASAFVVVAIVVLLVLAIRYLIRNGSCAACGDVENCRGSSGGCGGCPHSGARHRSNKKRHRHSVVCAFLLGESRMKISSAHLRVSIYNL